MSRDLISKWGKEQQVVEFCENKHFKAFTNKIYLFQNAHIHYTQLSLIK